MQQFVDSTKEKHASKLVHTDLHAHGPNLYGKNYINRNGGMTLFHEAIQTSPL